MLVSDHTMAQRSYGRRIPIGSVENARKWRPKCHLMSGADMCGFPILKSVRLIFTRGEVLRENRWKSPKLSEEKCL